ncbi:hypothetical protein QTN47_25845 [Danxiaibacter flavus]|uniref:O-antigen ligase-related domain-containing protein n=1 Tax=Danxiaibacter flavus TaxID=3049108 RepID=A0ABV3ZMC1_9BACT|nr:hypothetical protein QNM32_25845 [Chitinophagaceae bacterium DXS]
MKKTRELLVLLFLFSIAIYFLFYHQYAFNIELYNNAQYFIAFVALTIWFIFLILSGIESFSGRPAFAGNQMRLVLITSVFICIMLFSQYYSFSNEYFTCLVILLIFFSMFPSLNMQAIHLGIVFFSGMFFWELYLVFRQMDFFSFKIGLFNVEGSFQNSGILCCYLVSQLPFVFYTFFEIKKPVFKVPKKIYPKWDGKILLSIKKTLFSASVLFVSMIIWGCKSRTALIAFVLLICAYIFSKYARILKVRILTLPRVLVVFCSFLFAIVICCGVYHLFFLKKLSTYGRMMKLEIGFDHFFDHFWLGTGIGRFTWYYPQWQMSYFKNHTNPPTEYFLSASDSFILFNDFLQLFETVGALFFFVLLLFVYSFFKKTTPKCKALLNASKLTVVVIFTCGFTSYLLQTNILLLMLFFCFGLPTMLMELSGLNNQILRTPKKLNFNLQRLVVVLSMVIGLAAIQVSWRQLQGVKHWERARNYSSRKNAQLEYQSLYPVLKFNGKFLSEFGMLLTEDSANYYQATIILKEAQKYFLAESNIAALGICYKKVKNIDAAITTYVDLVNYIPSKFKTRLELLKLYVEANDTFNVRKAADIILTMPVKIPSIEVNWIKEEVHGIKRSS